MITEIRAHIKTAIQTCQAQYRPTERPFFNDSDVVGTTLDYTYHVEMGDAAFNIQQDQGVVSSIPITLRTYRQGGRDKNLVFDEGYTQALTIASLVIDNLSIAGASYIKGVNVTGVSPSEVSDSEDVYVYVISLDYLISYCIE